MQSRVHAHALLVERSKCCLGDVCPLPLCAASCKVRHGTAEQVLPEGDKIDLAMELQDYVLACMGSQHGNHVIQKMIECVQPSTPLQFVTEVCPTVCCSLHACSGTGTTIRQSAPGLQQTP